MRALLVLALLASACQTVSDQALGPADQKPSGEAPDPARDAAPRADAEERIANLLDAWHRAAKEVDADTYLGSFTEDAIFLGTDASERWTLAEFSEYVKRYFVGEKRGWEYAPRDRHIVIDGDIAWFDELLDNAGYGELRGTGVLRRTDAGWRIAQYNMTFTIPNEAAQEVVGVVKRLQK